MATAAPAHTHEVVRPFESGDQVLPRGARVAARGWRNVRALEEQRFIRPLLPADLAGDETVKGKSAAAQASGKGKD